MRSLARAVLAVSAALLLWSPAEAAEISGAGSTFAYPLIAQWADAYKAQTGIGINYQSIGSGAGITQVERKTVAFGVSDMPLKPQQLEEAGLIQFPILIGGVVPTVSLPGIGPGKVTLDGGTLADIYLGKIKRWSDPAIARLNPTLKLPDLPIAPVFRADGSGTTFIFTHYLSQVSPQFRARVGEATFVEWPVGIGGKGNEGVAAMVERVRGAIGYVEYALVKENRMTYTGLVNQAGDDVLPDMKAFQAAAANADWRHAPGFHLLLTNQPGAATWPITGASFVLMHKVQTKIDTARQVLDFFAWAYAHGQASAEAIDYVPLPQPVVDLIERRWHDIKGPDGQPAWRGPSLR